jgi:hypothetical protein
MKTTTATNPATSNEVISPMAGRRGRAWRHRALGVLCTCALAAPGFLLGAAPAQAANACTVTPHRPDYSYTNKEGVKVLQLRVSVSCTKARIIHFTAYLMEEDDWPNGDDQIAIWFAENEPFAAGESAYFDIYYRLPDTESGNEEVYQEVGWHEESNGVHGATSWVISPVLSIAN